MPSASTRSSGAALLPGARTSTSTAAALSDSELLRNYQTAGDQLAFATLVARYQNMVFGTAYRRTGNSELARDVAQEVFTALSQKARSLLGRPSVGGWLHRAALYASLHAIQSEARRRARQERFVEQVDQVIPPLVGNSSIPEAVSLVDEALEALPAADREALVLRYFQDLSYEEMARILGLSEAAARQRVSRSLERLGRSLTARGVTSSAVAVLLAAMAVQSTVAVPAGLATAALSAAAAGASSSAFLLLWTIVPPLATKTAAGLIAVAGGTILWHLAVPSQPLLPESSKSNSAVIEYRADIPPARFANVPAARQTLTQETPTNVALSVVQVRQPPASLVVGQTPLSKTAGSTDARRATARNRPAIVQEKRGTRSANRPTASLSSNTKRTNPPIKPDLRRAEPEIALTASNLALTPALAASVEMQGVPKIVDELRQAEPFPLQAAEVSSRIVEDAVVLEEPDKARLKDLLLEHHQQLKSEGVAGSRPPHVSEDDWRRTRGLAIGQTVNNVQGALGRAMPDPKVVADVLALIDKADAFKKEHAMSHTEDKQPPAHGLAIAHAAESVQEGLPALPDPKGIAHGLTGLDKLPKNDHGKPHSHAPPAQAHVGASQHAPSLGKASAMPPAAAAARSENPPSAGHGNSRGASAAPGQIGR